MHAVPVSPPSTSRAAPRAAVEQDLADLRRRWGNAYRITWEDRFRATHITSGQAIDAGSAPELHKRIRHHYSEHATGPRP